MHRGRRHSTHLIAQPLESSPPRLATTAQNDTITLHSKSARDPQVKLAISYALSQSTKLSLYEKRVMEMVEETRHLPEALVRTSWGCLGAPALHRRASTDTHPAGQCAAPTPA